MLKVHENPFFFKEERTNNYFKVVQQPSLPKRAFSSIQKCKLWKKSCLKLHGDEWMNKCRFNGYILFKN